MALENENQFLDTTLRSYLNGKHQNVASDQHFLCLFQGADYFAINNNYYASRLANGIGTDGHKFLTSGICPRMEDILVSKISNNVSYDGDDTTMNQMQAVLDKEDFAVEIDKITHIMLRSGRCVTFLNFNSGIVSFSHYSLFRSKINYNYFDEIESAEAFIIRDEINVYTNYIVKETRFYKNGIAYQRFSVVKTEQDKQNGKVKSYSIEAPEQIKEKYSSITFDKDIMLNSDNLNVYVFNNTTNNSRFPNTNIPDSQYINIQDTIVELESGRTYKEIDKNLGRGRVLVNERQNIQTMNSRLNNVQNYGYRPSYLDKTFMVSYDNGSLQEQAPLNVQFNLRTAEWRQEIEGTIGDICSLFGITVLDYDPRLLQEGQRTDDEINAMTDITASTVVKKRKLMRKSLNKILRDVAILLKIEPSFFIRFSMQQIINPTKHIALITQELANGLISKEKAMRECFPDYTQKEIEEEMKLISEQTEPIQEF